MSRQHLSIAIAVGAVLWAVALVSAVIIAITPLEPLQYVSRAVYQIAAFICHQRPERSFATAGVPWPVCSRCAGLYAGALIGSLIAFRLRPPQSWVRLVQATRRWLPVAAAPTALTLVIEWATSTMPTHLTRAASAVPLGATLAVVLILAAAWPPRAVAIH